MRHALFLILACFLLTGCKGSAVKPESTHVDVEVPSDPAEKLREQLRSASVQLSSAKEALQSASKAAADVAAIAGAPKDLKDGMQDVEDLANEASGGIDPYMAEPMALVDFRKNLEAQKKKQAATIKACNEALVGLEDSLGIVDSLSETAKGKFQNPLEEVGGNLDEASDSIRGAIEALGGKVEKG